MKPKYAEGNYLVFFFNHFGRLEETKVLPQLNFVKAVEEAELELSANKEVYESFAVSRVLHNSKEKKHKWD